MIKFIELEQQKPFSDFKRLHELAINAKQKNIDAICISSFNQSLGEVRSRFVNLKYIKKDKFYFFTNYDSPKSQDFLTHNQVSISIFWNQINIQIRIQGHIYRASDEESDNHFNDRSIEKNALAISSNQSKPISKYDDVVKKYKSTLLSIIDGKIKRPNHWGGFYVEPYSIEFWEGHSKRINKREIFKKNDSIWTSTFLEP